MADDPDRIVSASELSRWLGITQQAVSKHAVLGHIIKTGTGFKLRPTIVQFVEHQRAAASGRLGGVQGADLTTERTRLAAAQADAQEIKNAIARGELVSADDVEREWFDAFRSFRSRMQAIVGRLRVSLGHLQPSDFATIDREVRDALTAAGNGEVEDFPDVDREDGDAEGDQGADPAAED